MSALLDRVAHDIIGRQFAAYARTFAVHRQVLASTGGRVSPTWPTVASVTGILTVPQPQEREQFEQAQRPVTHYLEMEGAANLQNGDRLDLGTRHFYVLDVLDPYATGLRTRVLLQERWDV